MSKATSVSDLERAEHLPYSDGSGVKRVSIYNNGTQSNVATEETLQSMVMSVNNSIETNGFDLNAAPYSETTSITNDYIFDSIELNFSTAEEKTITIISSDGTLLWGGNVDTSASNYGYATTKQNFNLIFKQSFKSGENITVTVTQTTGPCLMDCILKTQQGGAGLGGNPILDPTSKVQLVDVNGVEIAEPYFNTIKTMDIVHYQTHSGKLYSAGYFNETVVDDGTLELLFQTGSNPIHFTAHADVGGNSTAILYENCTFSNAGTSLTASNHRRSSTNTTTVTITHTPSITLNGTQINSTLFIPGGSGGKAIGASSEGFESEMILKPNTNYLLSIKNISGQTHPMAAHVTYYEQY